MKKFRQLAFVTTLVTYFAIFMGGLVRVSGAGLGCPDWPKCFGRWFPPTNVGQLPPDIDPSLFNLTLAWIEYINRLAGVILGLLILIIALWAIKSYRKVPRIIIPSVIAALLVAFQGWQGGQVVTSELRQLYVSIHMGLAFIIVSLMIYITQNAYYVDYPDDEKGATYPKGISLYIVILWVLTMVQVIMGTEIRSLLEYMPKRFPLLSSTEWLGKAGAIVYIHAFLGISIAVGAWQTAVKIFRESKNPSSIVRVGAWGIMILALLQVLVGAILSIVGLPEVMRIFHLWIAALLIGIMLVLYSALKQYRRIQ
ncbi:Cytochrome oxidase assembly [Candidatus Zixiibacteriota bacterium]|nr:Cytochrome oxidase assembly [candidate division Zixibacteria bacterium]